MKGLTRVFGMGVAVVIMSANTVFAQSDETTSERTPILTEEQQGMREVNKASNVANREALKATFTEEQMEMVAANKVESKTNREAFDATLTDEQIEAMKEVIPILL